MTDDNQKIGKETIISTPSTTSVVTSKYVIVGETALHKQFALYWGFGWFITGITVLAIGVYTNWYSIFAIRLGAAAAKYWYITVPLILILSGYGYFKLTRKQRNQQRNNPKQPQQKQVLPRH
jgi:hypothetical protein